MLKQTFTVEGKTAALYASAQADKPLVVLNDFSGDGSDVLRALEELRAPACNLLVVSGLNWDHDMSPWYCPPMSPQEAPCTGGADAYLTLLCTEILPKAKTLITGEPPFVCLSGYSLAGLFALYAMYRCSTFDRVASMSGSLWFPDFREYAVSHDLQRRPDKLYLSLGDREARARHPLLRTVQENTEALAAHYREMGLDVTWELNPGNHFKDAEMRCAKGILKMLEG